MSKNIICVGFCCVDVLVRGMHEIDRSKEHIAADNITIWGGGDAFNEAVVLGQLGNNVKILTGLGTDGAAAMLKSIMRKAKVDYTLSEVQEGGKTSIAVPIVFQDAERCILASGLSASLNFYMNPEKIIDAKVVSLGSLYFPPLSNEKNTLEIVKKAKKNGSIVCADMMWINDGSCTLEKYKEVWSYIDYFFPNEEEAANLTGEKEAKRIATLLALKARGIDNIIIIDLFDNRLEKAEEMGAKYSINSGKGDMTETVMRLTNGQGTTYVFETAGNPVTTNAAAKIVKCGGKIVMVGQVHQPVEYDFFEINSKEVDLLNVFRYANIYPMAIESVNSGLINVEQIVTDKFDWKNAQKAFETALHNKQEALKVVIENR